MFAGPLTLAFFFICASVCISLFLPEKSTQEKLEKAANPNLCDTLENDSTHQTKGLHKISFTAYTAAVKKSASINDAIKKESLNKQVLAVTKQEDAGLQYYRQLSTRPAVINFYSEITGCKEIAIAILEHANKNDIPLSLGFALAYCESRYNINAVNRNTNNSIDRGLFQLNNKSFPYIKEKDFFDPHVSAKQGLAFLRYCLNTAGNEVSALAMYNAGPTCVRSNRTPQQTLNHISNITNYQKGLDELFAQKIAALNELHTQPLIAMSLNK
ncbi:MAG TPA: transglycosylase SLT domain-containing protein [Treponemataceae bacterium]|nr:transglycosylase SLT domain-containing protein [Treponemataceae bacterium]